LSVITNLQADDARAWTDQRILTEYKEQSTVEQHFRFLKQPKVIGPVYLKSLRRIHALAFVFLLALLVYSVIQRRARQALIGARRPMRLAGKKTSWRPTGHRVLQRFQNMRTLRDSTGQRHFPTNLKVPRRVLALIGLTAEIYLALPP